MCLLTLLCELIMVYQMTANIIQNVPKIATETQRK